jgi:hypothetical protein
MTGPNSHCKIDFPIFKSPANFEIQNEDLPDLKNIQTWHEASIEHGEQLCPLAQLQIPTASHVINSRTDPILNLL